MIFAQLLLDLFQVYVFTLDFNQLPTYSLRKINYEKSFVRPEIINQYKIIKYIKYILWFWGICSKQYLI